MPSNTSQLSEAQGRMLLRLARATLRAQFGQNAAGGQTAERALSASDPDLQKRSGIFVTLKIGGCLRGCIGSLVGREPLIEGVRTYSLHAAFQDPRFRPLTESELDKASIEVSVLTEPQPLTYQDANDLMAKLRPHVDGVTICKGRRSATFLPQVWEQLPDPVAFLSQLCLKAGLAADAWRTGELSVETYQVQHFEE
jgi:AmmeMemoRadiSam system protein A